ncbi:MAG: energy-coupling factor transporter transmembrane protein EcfT [Eubacterium sp.]|nr:energy-coupling factor transporter transmembrane protein EcfT [Eubacterium sp.]
MLKEGLGEDTEFSGFHPWVNLIFFALAIGITMFSQSPWFLAVTTVAAWIYSVMLGGVKQLRFNIAVTAWSVLVFSLINMLFSHNGATVLFYISGNRVTLEALLYGASMSVMFAAMVIWFSCFNVIMTAEKLIYIFGKFAPVLGLTLSMIFRYIPLLKARFQEIRLGQECLGRNLDRQKSIIGKVRQFGKEISILISWSLESSIEGADSMEARGYGLRGRTSFHLYRFTTRDALFCLIIAVFAAGAVYGMINGKASTMFYPVYKMPPLDATAAFSMMSFAAMLLVPAAMDLYGEIRWKKSGSSGEVYVPYEETEPEI